MENVLYLKYRPQTLEEIVGNAEIVEIIKSHLAAASPMPHSILLHGPTGCGKTTIGRIIANALGAKNADLKEIDSADFRGIDTIRDIRKQSMYAPLESSCRVWILDEVHRATGDAQSALLKALEDTPSHVYYILCTTDPQKLLPAIRGRCSQLQVNPLTDLEMKILLRRVVKAENETLSKAVYEQIIRDSLGHPRNALQILSQVLSVKDEVTRLKVAQKTAETESKTIELCRALIEAATWKKVSGILSGLKNEDAERIRRAVLGYCQSILLNNENNQAAAIMQEFLEPFYDSGFPGLVFACYSIICSDDSAPF